MADIPAGEQDPSDTQQTPAPGTQPTEPQTESTLEGEEGGAAAVYQKRVPTVEAIRFTGENTDEVIKFVGKKFVKRYGEDELEVRIHGEHPQSPKDRVSKGGWVVKQSIGSPVAVVNDGDFKSLYEKTDKAVTPPPPEEEAKPASEQPEPEKPEEEPQAAVPA